MRKTEFPVGMLAIPARALIITIMRILLIVLALGALFLSWQQGWLGRLVTSVGGPRLEVLSPADAPNLADRIATRVTTERLRLNVPPLAADEEVEKWVLDAVKAGAKDPTSIAQRVRDTWPQYQDVRVVQTSSVFADGVLGNIGAWPDAKVPELTHLCVVVTPGKYGIGHEVTVLAGARLPLFSPEALSDPKQTKFYNTCTLCSHGQPCQIPPNVRAFKLRCEACRQIYAMLAADSEGKFRYVNEFLTGYTPPTPVPPAQTKLAELMAIWRAETWRCRYIRDVGDDDSDAWQTAEETQTLGQGDCEDSAILLADWLLARGFQTRVVIGTYDAARGPHAWVVVRLDGNDYLLESTEFPFNMQRPPLQEEAGSRYKPELLFDRLAIFIPKINAKWHGDYWAEETWERVTTKSPAPVKHAQASR